VSSINESSKEKQKPKVLGENLVSRGIRATQVLEKSFAKKQIVIVLSAKVRKYRRSRKDRHNKKGPVEYKHVPGGEQGEPDGEEGSAPEELEVLGAGPAVDGAAEGAFVEAGGEEEPRAADKAEFGRGEQDRKQQPAVSAPALQEHAASRPEGEQPHLQLQPGLLPGPALQEGLPGRPQVHRLGQLLRGSPQPAPARPRASQADLPRELPQVPQGQGQRRLHRPRHLHLQEPPNHARVPPELP